MRERVRPWGASLAALGMGLLAFLAVESAIACRVGFDLFLPVAEGVFLPGRLARLGAFLVVFLALGLTEKGKSLLAAWDRACQKDRWRWLTASVLAAAFLGWTIRVTVLTYMTIDEVSFLQAIANVPSQGLAALHDTLAHSAQENASAISIWLCALIGLGHYIDPDGYWYLGYHLLMLCVSLTVIGRCVLLRLSRRGAPAWLGCLITALLGAGLYLYAFARLAFTVTAAAVGTAAVALVLCRGDEPRRSGRVMTDILAGALMVLCFLQRRATGLAVGCFWALAVGYQLVRIWLAKGPGRVRAAGALVLACALTIALIGGLSFAGDRLESDEDYSRAEYYRSLIGDFLYNKLTYEQYEKAGVPKELATLMQGWFFMDERIDTDLMERLADIYHADLAAQEKAPLPVRLWSMVKDLAQALWADSQMLAQTALALALVLVCLMAWLRYGRRYVPEGLCALCAAGGALILLLYLIKDGRFPIRVFQAVAFPAIVTLVLMALSAPEGLAGPGRAAKWMGAVFAAGAAACCLLAMTAVPHVTDDAGRAEVFSEQTAIENYEAAHPDKTIVTSIYDARGAIADPLHPIGTYPANRVIWGYIGDLAKDTEDRLYADAFFREDVLFMSDRFSSLAGLLQYLSAEYGPVQAVLDAQLSPTVSVTGISPVSPGEDYTGWYEQNGMTYYFRDGEALTGEQTIDGERYTFAPAGADAQPVTIPGDRVVYTTDAYSLISGN